MELLHNILSNIWAVFLVVLFFGGSIFVHELGHFLAARRRGMHVDRFSIGFGPKIFSWRGKDGVEYRISWLPLGGYVALPQLADMSAIEGRSDTDLAKLPKPNYTTKVIVSAAGAFFNILFALALGVIVWLVTGEPSSSALSTNTVAKVVPTLLDDSNQKVPSPASLAGIQPGDTILKVDGKTVKWLGDIQKQLALSSGWDDKGVRETIFTIQRGDKIFDLTLNPVRSGREKNRKIGIEPVSILKFKAPRPDSITAKAGLQLDDQVFEIGQKRILTLDDFWEALKQRTKGPIEMIVQRGQTNVTVTIPVAANAKEATSLLKEIKPGIIYTNPNPFQQITNAITDTFRTMFALVNPRSDVSIASMGSAVMIVATFFDLAHEGIPFVLWFTIIINVSLAIFNLLPIPVLDGGHILFATISKLRGKALPVEFVATAQSIFMVLILSMMLYLGYRDFNRLADNGEEKPAETTPAQNDAAAAPVPAPAPAAP